MSRWNDIIRAGSATRRDARSRIAKGQTACQSRRMQTGTAIVVGAAILAATGAATAWMVQPRYSLANPGQGVTVRLDRRTGELLGCERLDCHPILTDAKMVSAVPAPPLGFNVVE